jgi:parallel beta-helix repeat protein
MLLVCAITIGSHINVQAASTSGLILTGNIYYVSTTGSDSNPGTATAPFKTFAKAAAILSAGSTLYILAGTYNEPLRISNSGTDGAWITVRPSGGAVVIDLKNTANSAVYLEGSYIDIGSLEVKGSTDICVKTSGNYLKISGLIVHECQTHGIFVSGQHVEVVGNRVYATSLTNQPRTMSSGWGSGIKIGLGGNDVLIRGNTAYHNYGEGIAATRGSNVTIRGNTVYDNFSVNVYVDNSFNINVEQNFVTCHANSGFERSGSPAAGIALGEEFYEGWGAQLNNVTITNNIVAFCSRGVYYFGGDPGLANAGLKNSTIAYNTLWASTNTTLGIMYGNGQVGSLITSNIIWQADNKLAYIENSAGLTFKNNLWKTTPPANVKGNGDRMGDPLFLNVPVYDPQTFELSALSPAISGALNIGVTTDYFDRLRGPSYEMGAVQYMNALPAPSSTNTTNPPTPTPLWTPTLIATNTPLPTSTVIPFTSTPAPAPLETIYNDKNPALIYSGNWQDVSKAKAYGGSYKQTRRIGSSVTLNFSGQSFGVLYATGTNFGRLDVYVDDQLVAAINQKTSQNFFQKRWDYSGQLSSGAHELRLVFTGPTDAKASLDAVIVR